MDEKLFLDRLFARMRQPWLTIVIIALNALVFAALVLTGGNPLRLDSARLISAGALYGPAVLQGEHWRLASAMFLHGGLLHIALNMFALWQAGSLVERLFGHQRFLALYLGAGLCGAITSLWWKPAVLSVGASGAIFGVYGALLGYMLGAREAMPLALMRELRASALAFIGFSLFAGFVMPGIDNAAHVGGLIGGLLLGLGFARPLGARLNLRAGLRALLCVALTLGMTGLMWRGVRPAQAQLQRQIEFARSVRLLAMTDQALARRTSVLVEAFLDGTVEPAEARRGFEQDLLPRWDALLASLRAQPVGDPRRTTLIAYATARRNAVAAFARAAATGNLRWVREAFAWQNRAGLLLQKLEAGRPAAASEPGGTKSL
ncbi:rhomboid family intramembrane serine protease [Niveibacterium terrae]|uniref:rhomboid family intramembrane serine protease n=1 Tax=Niveibacterium terrae TaxID=3373598 RepID=UPI003A8EA89E